MIHNISRVLVILLLINVLFVSRAYAYLDPNAGGFFLQVVIPFVFAAAAGITVFWRRVIGYLKDILRRFSGRSNS